VHRETNCIWEKGKGGKAPTPALRSSSRGLKKGGDSDSGERLRSRAGQEKRGR